MSEFKLTAYRNPDGKLAGRPYVQTDGRHVCEGFTSEELFKDFERLVNLANSASELLGALVALHGAASDPHLNEEDAEYDSHVAGLIKAAEAAIAKAKRKKVSTKPNVDEKLIEFAKRVLLKLESDSEWSSDTTGTISEMAFNEDLAVMDEDGQFQVNRKVVKL